jgi:hypothetical protein
MGRYQWKHSASLKKWLNLPVNKNPMEKERQLLSLKISSDLDDVEIMFTETSIFEIPDGAEPDAENDIRQNTFKVNSNNRPHKDLTNSMLKLRKHCLDILGIELSDESKAIKHWIVPEIKIDGDVFKKQSRVSMVLAKHVELTGKVTGMKVPQVTMYPKSDDKVKYHAVDKMTSIVEDIIEECWMYLDGKYEEGLDGQLALFPRVSHSAVETAQPVLKTA